LTLFLIPADAAAEMRSKSVGIDEEVAPPSVSETVPAEENEEKELLDEVVSKAAEFIEDRIARLNWRQMQELVAGLLEAMGYRARVSPDGSDRGVDIFASPDGLGLEQPRIFVEVKHRLGKTIGAQEVRSFIGGRQMGDRCLYVSTGGFTREARYEADRSTVPLRLLSLPDLRELLTEHYPKLEAGIAALVPLEKIYWPTA
jgi:restriction system protein